MNVKGKEVKGIQVDSKTRCAHYSSEVDIIAIKFKCCETYYPCINCHEELAGHHLMTWKKEEFNSEAVLCGSCGHELTIKEYMTCLFQCPSCSAKFNPGCSNHYHFYFDVKTK
jgi:uncharacterized CHY-type Zn-finger protein